MFGHKTILFDSSRIVYLPLFEVWALMEYQVDCGLEAFVLLRESHHWSHSEGKLIPAEPPARMLFPSPGIKSVGEGSRDFWGTHWTRECQSILRTCSRVTKPQVCAQTYQRLRYSQTRECYFHRPIPVAEESQFLKQTLCNSPSTQGSFSGVWSPRFHRDSLGHWFRLVGFLFGRLRFPCPRIVKI